MRDAIDAHHRLEEHLYRLRLLRDLRDPEFRPEFEDAVLDEMDALWCRMGAEDRRVLEGERAARAAFEAPLHVPEREFPAIDVDAHARRLLPPRVAVGAV